VCRNPSDPAGCTCASERGLVSVGPASVARVRLVDALNRRFVLLFFVSRHPEPHLSCFRDAFARPALFPSPRRLIRRSSSFSCGVSRRRRSSPVLRPPRGVGGAPRGALRNRSRLRSATTVLARHGPSRATGRRLSALHRGGLRTARPRVTCPIVPRTMPRLPAAGRTASRSGPAASRPRLHRGFGTPHPAPPQNVSGDAPHERGWGGYSTDALCRQDRIHM
jgi:hypothetical protein